MLTEDEAFIRTIVDSPGDDLPRLVYADWLDERDDPRGPFLRAEVEWAQPWKDGKRPGDATELRAMAAGLDPLWVARVSRPPMGVCCDHITFDEGGYAVTVVVLAECERRLQVRFGVEFAALLLNHNGGHPSPTYFVHPTKRYPYAVHWFLPATIGTFKVPMTGRPFHANIESYTPKLNNADAGTDPTHSDWSKWERAYLPLAFDGEFHCVAIGQEGRRAGKVYFLNSPTVAGSSTPRLVADSIPDFLSWFAKPSWA